ncbi:CynX/NimT family MFS transporter [Terrihalobacillus insolitus]|uniref:CynX/NimT family MFS transporter n=1 Tax=Terrihalobacillus insolitus TaxID=2950438 RepID=UPI0023411E03|nr:MFS transporter [Terrihalobacillus insolitus]MDC3413225.1 MFS transporter [Terrihalobacillus insolitus]
MLLITGIILVAFNLRPAITSIGPLLGTIRDDIGLANWSAGLITSLPLLAFAVMSPMAPKFANRLGNERTLLIGLTVLLIGISVRSIAITPTLFIGTTLVGLGIAICNVLLPGVIKDKFPDKIGMLTSIYSTSMGMLAATASGLSIPLANGLGLGWQKSLFSWAGLVAVGILVWIVLIRTIGSPRHTPIVNNSVAKLWSSMLAWQVTLFMGLQSFMFYVTISWLPEILNDFGLAIATSGWLLSYMQFVSLPATFLSPILAGKFSNQQGIVVVIGSLSIVGFGGLFFADTLVAMILFITLIGIAQGASISLSLAFLGMRASNAKQAAELSGMAQSIGYLLAAIGPMFIGLLYDLTNNWTLPLTTLLIVAGMMIFFGLGAGRNKVV